MAKVKIQDTWIDITNCKTEKEFVDVCYEVYGKPSVINVTKYEGIPDGLMTEEWGFSDIDETYYPEPELFGLIASGKFKLVHEFVEQTGYEIEDCIGSEAWKHIPEEYEFNYVDKNVRDIISEMEHSLKGEYSDFEDFAREHYEERYQSCDCYDWINWDIYIDEKRLEYIYEWNITTNNVWQIEKEQE